MQIIYFLLFITFLTAILFFLNFLKIKYLKAPFTMFITSLWFICFITGNLNYKISIAIGNLGVIDIRYSSAIYLLIFTGILLVYITEGIHETRELIYISIGTQVLISIIQIFFNKLSFYLLKGEMYQSAAIIFTPSYWRLGVSIFTTVIDLFIAVMIFQYLINNFKKLPFIISIFAALTATMFIDSLLFVGATRYNNFFPVFTSHILFKTGLLSLIIIPFTFYLKWFEKNCKFHLERGTFDIFKKIEHLEDDLSTANNRLKEYAATLELKVESRTKELKDSNDKLNLLIKELSLRNDELRDAQNLAAVDLNMAISVQKSLTSKDPKDKSEWDIAYKYTPIAGISGDFYDFYEQNKKLKGVGLFDVSGHGTASGLITIIGKSIISRIFKNLLSEKLNKVIHRINDVLQFEIGDADNYITGVLLRFKEKNIVEYVNAAHPDIILKKKSGAVTEVCAKTDDWRGMFLGITEMNSKFKVLQFPVAKDDMIMIFSDCIVESTNRSNIEYGHALLMKSLKEAPFGNAKKTLDYVLKAFYDFMGDKPLSDDLTIMLLKKK